jgi:glycosyltransferase involved in cell wall biosynthesis
MVVLEARTLDLPVITTRFPSVAGSVPEGAGLIVEQTVDALAEGMEQVLSGDVPSQRLDWAAYNGDAMRQFYSAIGAD